MPSSFRRIVTELKRQERRLVAQLASIRTAISSLEFGGAGVPAPAIIETPYAAHARRRKRKRRPMSPAARRAVSARMKRYWAAKRRSKARRKA